MYLNCKYAKKLLTVKCCVARRKNLERVVSYIYNYLFHYRKNGYFLNSHNKEIQNARVIIDILQNLNNLSEEFTT